MKKYIDRTLEITLIAIMSILVIDVTWQVISRYVLTNPSSFTDELASFLLIWVGILGAAYVAGKQEHLAIDLLLQKSSPERQKKIMLIINSLILLFAVSVMVVGGTWLVATRFMLGVNSSAMHLPLGYVYLVMPLSGVLICYYSILFIIDNLKK